MLFIYMRGKDVLKPASRGLHNITFSFVRLSTGHSIQSFFLRDLVQTIKHCQDKLKLNL